MSSEEKKPRIGVFVCHCGKNIAGTADVDAITEYCSKLPDVVIAKDHRFLCSQDGQNTIKKLVKEFDIERVLVASCSPDFHAPTFRKCIKSVGLNEYFLGMADIRQHTMGPGRLPPAEATEKAKELIKANLDYVREVEVPKTVRVPVTKSCLVIGAGISGITAALDLAEHGFKVYMLDRRPTIGGCMGLLNKTYPTDDCASCILAPQMSAAANHENISILTNCEVKEVDGRVGSFKVKITKKPRYVDEEKCLGCGLCAEKCPVRVKDWEYNGGLGYRKAIYLPFEQAIPMTYIVDPTNCLYLQKEICRVCEKICEPNAIDFDQKSEEFEIEVGAIILATGFKEFDPSPIKEYGYGSYKNVVTLLQFARMTDEVGPTEGKIVRPSDEKPAKRIVIVLCVGSRDRATNPYCSYGVCCMASLKYAMITLEYHDPEAEFYICYTDMRTFGKGYEDYYEKARKMGINFIRGKPSEIIEDPRTNKLTVELEDTLLGEPVSIEADLVVLACGMRPSNGTNKLAEMLGVGIGPYGFFQELHPKLRPVETWNEGVFVCGACQGPKDIETSVVQAKAVAISVANILIKDYLELLE